MPCVRPTIAVSRCSRARRDERRDRAPSAASISRSAASRERASTGRCRRRRSTSARSGSTCPPGAPTRACTTSTKAATSWSVTRSRSSTAAHEARRRPPAPARGRPRRRRPAPRRARPSASVASSSTSSQRAEAGLVGEQSRPSRAASTGGSRADPRNRSNEANGPLVTESERPTLRRDRPTQRGPRWASASSTSSTTRSATAARARTSFCESVPRVRRSGPQKPPYCVPVCPRGRRRAPLAARAQLVSH